jgi:hypothetical protein
MQGNALTSARPELIVDFRDASIADENRDRVGMPGPFGRSRIISTLAMAPALLVRPQMLSGADGGLVADPDGFYLGTPGVRVNRMISVAKTADTRRL